VDRVAVGGFAQVKLVVGAGDRIPATVDAVGPGHEQLARRARWELVGLVARDYVFSLVGQLTQAGAELGDDSRKARADQVLAAVTGIMTGLLGLFASRMRCGDHDTHS
jgi:hypothetical protein